MDFSLPFKEKEQTGYEFLATAGEDELQPAYASDTLGTVIFMFGYIVWTGYSMYLMQMQRQDLLLQFWLYSGAVLMIGITALREGLARYYNDPAVHRALIYRIDGSYTSGPIVVKKSTSRHISWLEERIKSLKQELSPEELRVAGAG